MDKATVKIIAASTAGENVCAAAGRISTMEGTALEIYHRTLEKDNNAALIGKVIGSGHTSVLEHAFFTVAFDSVSVFTEQFVIEFRLGSYTVQSRRYVDYSRAGFFAPPLPDALNVGFRSHMQSLFDDYAMLLALGIPKEDARFVLPYCFRSNFFVTMNARELLLMVMTMTKGRGRHYTELRTLGQSLAAQLSEFLPDVPEILSKRYWAEEDRFAPLLPERLPEQREAEAETELLALSPAGSLTALLQNAAAANWAAADSPLPDTAGILRGERPRELELIHAQFTIRNLSLAAITHLVRHRVQTVLVPHIAQAVRQGTYLLPESVRENPQALTIYRDAFARTRETLARLTAEGLPADCVQYFALAGNQLDVLCDMDGRELLHFMKLRTCTRAQWEIRACAVSLLEQLREKEPALFSLFGPSCYVLGKCPEGRLSCGRQAEMQARFAGGEEVSLRDD
ncbi:MAG: FAD-dependent thymidylate synthase [Oscillospiraceae bacterium]|nr:FAD-dependent thymidylate synthase [Oscillospiraceae bacterium]